MGILNPPPFPTEGDDDSDDDAEMASDKEPAGPFSLRVVVDAAVTAGIHAALEALHYGAESGQLLSDDEAELLDAYRNAGELHRTTALRTLKRAAETKDES
jgi:hypothetical protein